jgi:hypothetical protein
MMPPRSFSEQNGGSGIDPGGLLIDRTLKRKVDESDMTSRGTKKRLKQADSTVPLVQDFVSEEDGVSSDKADECEPNNDEPEDDEPKDDEPEDDEPEDDKPEEDGPEEDGLERDETEGNKPDERLPPVIGYRAALSKTIDTTLPPMNRLDDIFAHMATRALDKLEFESVLDAIPVLNIATMCSGTEAPLLALRMLNKSKCARA